MLAWVPCGGQGGGTPPHATPLPRSGHSFTTLVGGDVHVLFGGVGGSPGAEAAYLADAHVARVGSDGGVTWQPVVAEGPAPAPRARHTAVALDSRRLLVWGGLEHTARFNDCWVLDVSAQRWAPARVQGGPPSPRAHHTACKLGNKMFVFGGACSTRCCHLQCRVARLPPRWPRVRTTPPRPPPAAPCLQATAAAARRWATCGCCTWATTSCGGRRPRRLGSPRSRALTTPRCCSPPRQTARAPTSSSSWAGATAPRPSPTRMCWTWRAWPGSRHRASLRWAARCACGWRARRLAGTMRVLRLPAASDQPRGRLALPAPAAPQICNHLSSSVESVPYHKVFTGFGKRGPLQYLSAVQVLDAGDRRWSVPEATGAEQPCGREDTAWVWDARSFSLVLFGGWANCWLGDTWRADASAIVGPGYACLGISPAIGPVAGGTSATITGLRFRWARGSAAQTAGPALLCPCCWSAAVLAHASSLHAAYPPGCVPPNPAGTARFGCGSSPHGARASWMACLSAKRPSPSRHRRMRHTARCRAACLWASAPTAGPSTSSSSITSPTCWLPPAWPTGLACWPRCTACLPARLCGSVRASATPAQMQDMPEP